MSFFEKLTKRSHNKPLDMPEQKLPPGCRLIEATITKVEPSSSRSGRNKVRVVADNGATQWLYLDKRFSPPKPYQRVAVIFDEQNNTLRWPSSRS